MSPSGRQPTWRSSFALVLWGLAALAALSGSAAAQTSSPDGGVSVAGAWDGEVRARIARAVGVPVERIHLVSPGDGGDRVGEEFDSLAVRRGDANRWMVTVWEGSRAVRVVVRVGISVEASVAARELPRGHVVGPEDVMIAEQVRWGDPGVRALPDPVGMVAERKVRAGEVLEAPIVRPPFVVRSGEPIEAVFRGEGLELRVRGEALTSARSGGRVQVRLESGLRFEATAVQHGVVQLVLGGR